MDTAFTELLKLYTVKKSQMPLELQFSQYIDFVKLFSDNHANAYINKYVKLRKQCKLAEMVDLYCNFEDFVYTFRQEPN